MKGPFFPDNLDTPIKREYYRVNREANKFALIALGFFLIYFLSLMVPHVIDIENLSFSKYWILTLVTVPSASAAMYFFFKKAMPLADKRMDLLGKGLSEDIEAVRFAVDECIRATQSKNTQTVH